MRKIGINISPEIIYGAGNFIDAIAANGFDCVFYLR